MAELTRIRVTEEQADRLYEMQERGEAYHDVVDRLLDAYETQNDRHTAV